MVQFTLPKNSKVTEGKNWPHPAKAKVEREYRVYRWNPDDGNNPSNSQRIRRGWYPAQKFSVSEQSAHYRRKQPVQPKPGWIVKGAHVAVRLALELRVRNAHQQFHITDGFERHPYRAKVLIQAETEKYGMLVRSAVGDRREFQVVRQQGCHLGAVQIIHNDGGPYVAVVVPDAVRIVWFTRLALWRELGAGLGPSESCHARR